MVRNGHAMGVACQVLEHVFWSAEWRFGIDHPVLTEQLPQKPMKCLRLLQMFEASVKAELLLAEKRFNPATNLPRKTRLSTFTGRKKGYFGWIHREWSGDNPPAGITQCTWG